MRRNRLIKIIFFVVLFFSIVQLKTYADVGSFESYSNKSNNRSKSWKNNDSANSYGRNTTYNSNYTNNNTKDESDFKSILTTLGMMGGASLIAYLINQKVLKKDYNAYQKFTEAYDDKKQIQKKEEKSVLEQIKSYDVLFNEKDFSEWVKELFIKLQYAWSDRDLSVMKFYETKELYEQHLTLLQRNKKNNQINKIEKVGVDSVEILSFNQVENKDVLEVVVHSKMIDYIIDENTKRIIKGDKEGFIFNDYKLTFVRKTGILTKSTGRNLNVINCPNCGAPVEMASLGKCSYCGSIISTQEHDWVLSNLERYYNKN